jgi:hypothetical protein
MKHRWLGNLIALLLAPILLAGLAEGALRLLPVNSGLNAQNVSVDNPALRYLPDRDYVYSKGPLLKMVNEGRVNNEGFVNDQDYSADVEHPLIAVIGDSFVEALMVPFPSTVTGQLDEKLKGKASVYSFAGSGAPLSQYLVWADYARQKYRPDRMIFVIVGNDFDESLIEYKNAPGFHYFKSDAAGRLELTRVDYAPSGLRSHLRRSALARYLVLNFNIEGLLANPKAWLGKVQSQGRFVGNVDAEADPARLARSRLAVHEFLSRLPSLSGLDPKHILFVVDGFRYPATSEESAQLERQSFFGQMRAHFIAEARQQGFEAIDMDTVFYPYFTQNREPYEFPIDGHWNALAHRLAAETALNALTLKDIINITR